MVHSCYHIYFAIYSSSSICLSLVLVYYLVSRVRPVWMILWFKQVCKYGKTWRSNAPLYLLKGLRLWTSKCNSQKQLVQRNLISTRVRTNQLSQPASGGRMRCDVMIIALLRITRIGKGMTDERYCITAHSMGIKWRWYFPIKYLGGGFRST